MSKVVLVTGASGGIGCACARLFAASGYKVAVHFNNTQAPAAALAEEIGGFLVQAELSDEAQVARMFEEIRIHLGAVDVLINNAGVAQRKLFDKTARADYEYLFSGNVLSAVNCSREAVKDMLHRHSGAIINISSMWGVSGASCEVLYSASKAALIGFTKALAKELGPSSINVNCIAPGVIDTRMNADLSPEDMAALAEETPLCRIGKAEDVAKAALFLASADASFITGQILGVDGGFIV